MWPPMCENLCLRCKYYKPYRGNLNLWGLLGGTYEDATCKLKDKWGYEPPIYRIKKLWDSTYNYHPCKKGHTAFRENNERRF